MGIEVQSYAAWREQNTGRLVWITETDGFGQTRLYARVLPRDLLLLGGKVLGADNLSWGAFT